MDAFNGNSQLLIDSFQFDFAMPPGSASKEISDSGVRPVAPPRLGMNCLLVSMVIVFHFSDVHVFKYFSHFE